ncbi:tagaturonate reductase [Metabacillus malikii]|uniref:Tagaturonate reductase n=1 Tax=Metabacillus malikii TaxID=1504265 RepID=A0ABT9ZL56_9BACI|nr:tagaturonate reductase [Metabacillus malikii]MDQ0232521.1 tagaturonate reductase [Metabacillus malikii]
MKQLSNEVIGENRYQQLPEKAIQFGTGNFLRGFIDWQVHEMNKQNLFNGRIVVIQSTKSGAVQILNKQDGLYTLYTQGIKNEKPVSEYEIIESVSRGIDVTSAYEEYLELAENPHLRFIFSNTTEAGIAFMPEDRSLNQPQKSYPGKLTAFLYKRFLTFKGDKTKGFIVFPCELIEHNGVELKNIIKKYAEYWGLGSEFIKWVEDANIFCDTLVDRIVPGFPKDTIQEKTAELNYKDELIVVAEQFHLFVIEGPETIKEEFPAELAGLNVHIVDDLLPYRLKKVRILNGAHTLMTPVSYLAGINTVHEAVTSDITSDYIQHVIYEEIIPALNFPKEDLVDFADDVINRFKNPFIQHYLSSIALNSISKFKARVLPTIVDYYEKHHSLPKAIILSLSSLLLYYRGKRANEAITLTDDEYVLNTFSKTWTGYDSGNKSLENIIQALLGDEKLWGTDLTKLTGLKEEVLMNVTIMIEKGVKEALSIFLKGEANEGVY